MAIVVLATKVVDVGPITRGVFVALLASALIVALENAPGGRVKRTLSTGPMTYLGRISYGTYLWHWPLIIFLTIHHSIAPVPLFVIDCIGATAIAALSFKVLESPIRFARSLDRVRGPVILIGFTTSILIGLLVMPVVLNTGSGLVASAGPSGGTQLLDWRAARADVPDVPDCLKKALDKCTVVKGSGKKMLLMGDSLARMWVPTFTEIAKREGLSLSIAFQTGCPWQRGLQYDLGVDITRPCAEQQKDWFDRVVPGLDPDIIVLGHQADDDPARRAAFHRARRHEVRYRLSRVRGDADQGLLRFAQRAEASGAPARGHRAAAAGARLLRSHDVPVERQGPEVLCLLCEPATDAARAVLSRAGRP